MPLIVITDNLIVQHTVAPDAVFAGLSEASIRQENAGANYFADANLALGNGAGEANVGILHLLGLAAAAIPVTATVDFATLTMPFNGGGFGSFGISAHASLRSVVLTEATYNSFATGSSWETAGARGALDKNAATDPITTVSDTDPAVFDISDAVQSLITNSGNQIILSPTLFDGDGGFRFFAKSTGTDGTRPEVAISYSVGTVDDTDPDQITFTDQAGVALSTVTTSNAIAIAGIDAAAPISIVGGEYSINGGAFTSASGTITVGQTVAVRGTSSASNSTDVDVVLTIGTITDTFTITTATASLFTDTTYDGSVLNYANTESWKELIENDYSDVLVTGGIVHWRVTSGPTTGSTVGADTIPDFASGVLGGEYEYTHIGVRSPTYTWTIEDFTPVTSISGNQAITIAENTVFSQIYTITNPVGPTTLVGADAAQLALTDNGTSVTVSRANSNFEAPADDGTDNTYNATVRNNGVDWPFVLTVTDDPNEFTIDAISNVSINEGVGYASAAPSITGTPEAPITWTLTGADSAQFTVNSSTGVTSMVARTFATPVDANGNNIYEVGLIATEAAGQTATQAWTLTVNDTSVPDTTAPVISITGGYVDGDSLPAITVGDNFTAPTATASDAIDGAITPVVTNNVNVSQAGVYSVTYTATDAAGNETVATLAQLVQIQVDATPPTITDIIVPTVDIAAGSTFAVTFTSNEAGLAYWAITNSATPPPQPFEDNQVMTAGPNTININAGAVTSTHLHFYTEDNA